MAAASLMQVLALYGAIRVCFANTYSVFLALNRPDMGTWLLAPTLVVLIPALLWATPRYGAVGAAWGLVLAGAVTFLLNTFFILRLLDLSASTIVSYAWRPVGAVATMVVVVALLRQSPALSNFQRPSLLELILVALVGASAYCITLLALWWTANRPQGVESILLGTITGRLRLALVRLRPAR
jgi:O-antigen/teichoic acid export membrane protein